MVKFIDLGRAIARIEDDRYTVELCIISPGSSATAIYFTPTRSVSICGIENVKTLQVALNDFFNNRKEK